jgi:glyoxylase-like metal-dependent hydrolase (beta-lactamase superfamily II)
VIGEALAPGLWRWTAYHEEWKEQVGCVAIHRDGEWILIDPLLEERQWAALLRHADQPLHVLLTIHWHARSAAEIAARRSGTRVWAYSRDAAPIRRRAPVSDVFRPGDPLPGGIEARPCRRGTEVLLWDAASKALISGDALVGSEGGVRTCPDSWLPSGATSAQMRESLRPLLELPIERLLVSHGEPVFSGGRQALAAALS